MLSLACVGSDPRATRRLSGSVFVKAWTEEQRDLAVVATHTRPAQRNLAATQHDVAGRMARLIGAPLRLMRIPRPAHGDPIFFQHRLEHLQARRDDQLLELGLRINQDVDQKGRCRCASESGWRRPLTVRDCFFMVAPFWGPRPQVCPPPYITTSREPPLQVTTARGTSPSSSQVGTLALGHSQPVVGQ